METEIGTNRTGKEAIIVGDPEEPEGTGNSFLSNPGNRKSTPGEHARTPHPQVTKRDLEIVAWLARMRFACAAQIARAFAMSPRMVYRRGQALCRSGLVRHERVLFGQPGVYAATAAGCSLAGSPLAPGPPRVDLLNYRHDLAVVSLAIDLVAAHPGAHWISERELRHRHTGGAGVGARVHVPDGVLLTPDGHRAAVELDLTPKTGRRLGAILRFYGRSRDYDAVRYYLPTPALAARITGLARGLPHITATVWTVPEEAGGLGQVRA